MLGQGLYQIGSPAAPPSASPQQNQLDAVFLGREGELMSNSPALSILVVDDDLMMRMLSGCMVESAGFNAVSAKNADDAIRVLEGQSDIRVVFTDVNMPGSMNGMELAAVIGRRWPAIGVLVTSGDASSEVLPAGRTFIQKPYSLDTVITALKDLSCSYGAFAEH
ncbi:MAG: response regulator receiver domain protein [Hyphomicrobiales bacterium]|jgi:DNA-binding NtrC family response regulator|nr:response regulator receiver domain protein [Hyphomicrobiales bacterium]